MTDNQVIHRLKSIPLYSSSMEKLTVAPLELSDEEKTYLLTSALILIKKYEKDKRCLSYAELSYYIILKYALAFNDYEPLYDFCVNFGFYPIAQVITTEKLIEFENISFSLIQKRISANYSKDRLVRTLEQKRTHEILLESEEKEISFVAPTSYGKSSVIIERISANLNHEKRAAIIVPTKSLLMQTYRYVRSANLGVKILIHDEMFEGENSFVAVLTQERALRMMDKKNACFDALYIDEAHRLLEKDSRSILLTRLIKLNGIRNPAAKTMYLSPLISDSNNLRYSLDQSLFEQRIRFNIKEPEIFEYRLDGSVQQYNRFTDEFYQIGKSNGFFEYIHANQTKKNFYYLYTPRKIERFAEALSETCEDISSLPEVCEIVKNLCDYVHEDFFAIEYVKHGIVYLHGKIPDNVKEYLEFKFATIPAIKYLVANKVILEGMNLPIDSLFVLSGNNLHEKDLTNLIGRVNRLDQVFGKTPNLAKLLPRIHFLNHEMYNRKNSKLENKIRLLKSSQFVDKTKNPLLIEYDNSSEEETQRRYREKIMAEEQAFFSKPNTPENKLKQKMIALGMNAIFDLSDGLCASILKRITRLQNLPNLHEIHYLDRLRYLFVRNFDANIIDHEFGRLKNDKVIAYYKRFFESRKKSLKEKIGMELWFYNKRVEEQDGLLYVGESYGEIPYSSMGVDAHKNVYIDLCTKSKQQLVNIAIVKLKLEEDFISYKLHMFFQLMYDYGVLSYDEYNQIIYGTTDAVKLTLVKMGLTINLINRLDEDGQLGNLAVDEQNNVQVNDAFETYKAGVDDFYRFELNRLL